VSAPEDQPNNAPADSAPLKVREAMWRLRVAWMFGAACMHITTGVALNLYATQVMRMDLFWLGVLGALPLMGAVTALPTSYFLARFGHRKRIFLIAGIAYRSMWVPIALIPWVLPQAWWWRALLVLHALASLATHVMSPAVLSWFADVIPARVRGRFFSVWSQGGAIVGLLVGQFVAWLLDHAMSQEALTRTISVAFAAAAVLGVIDFLWLLPIPDVGHKANPRITLRELFREPLADRSFRCYLGFSATRILSIGFLGQYIWLYLFEVVRVTRSTANVMVVVMPMLVAILVVRAWGRLVDRWGCKPTLLVGTVLVLHGAAAWVFVTPEHPWGGYAGVLVSVAAWSGVEVASFNLMLRMSASHGGRRQGSAYLALNSVTIAAAAALSGVLGGTVANWLGRDWSGSLLGLPLTYHGVLFLISSGLRFLALPWLILLQEPEARPTWAAVQYVFAGAFARLRLLVLSPLAVFRRDGAREADPAHEARDE